MKRSLTSALLVSLMSFLGTALNAADKVIAKVGDTPLTESDMRKDMGMQLYQAENQMYMIQRNWIDQKAQTMLFDRAAKAAGLSRAAWEAREIVAKAPPVD